MIHSVDLDMARPSGQFAQNRERCFAIISDLTRHGPCCATNTYFAAMLGCSTKQIQRYINSLRIQRRIWVKTGPLEIDKDKLYSRREIEITRVQGSEPQEHSCNTAKSNP